jgi:hypothetical protein
MLCISAPQGYLRLKRIFLFNIFLKYFEFAIDLAYMHASDFKYLKWFIDFMNFNLSKLEEALFILTKGVLNYWTMTSYLFSDISCCNLTDMYVRHILEEF